MKMYMEGADIKSKGFKVLSHSNNYTVKKNCDDDILGSTRILKMPLAIKEDYFLLRREDCYYIYIQGHGRGKGKSELLPVSKDEAEMFLLGELNEDWNTRDIAAYGKEFGKDIELQPITVVYDFR